MADLLRAAADVGLRRQRMVASGKLDPLMPGLRHPPTHAFGGRFTPGTHRSYSEAGSWVAGLPVIGRILSSGPGSGDGLFDKLTTAVTGGPLDPSTRLGYPASTPPDWAQQPDGDTKYAFYTEGVNAGFVRGFVGGGAVLAAVVGAVAFHLGRRRA